MPSAQTVTVGSKLPFPLTLEVTDKSGNVRKAVIRGAAVRPGQLPKHLAGGVEQVAKVDNTEQSFIAGASALTSGIDAELWEQWSREYAQAPYVKNGMVFAHAQKASAEDMATEKRGLLTGLEGLDAAKPMPHLSPLTTN